MNFNASTRTENKNRREIAMKVLVVYYSMYGHVYKLAQAAAEGARAVESAEVTLCRVPETLPQFSPQPLPLHWRQ